MSKLSDFETDQWSLYSNHRVEVESVSFWRHELSSEPVEKRDKIGNYFMDSVGRNARHVTNSNEHLNKYPDVYVHLAIAEAALDGVAIHWRGDFAENVVKPPQEEVTLETTIDMSAM